MFHDTRRTHVATLDELDLQEKDFTADSGHSTTEMSRRYSQSKKAAEGVRNAENKAQGAATALNAEDVPQTPPIKPSMGIGDWKAEIRELKEMLDGGMLTAQEFAAEKAKVMATRGT